MNARYGKTIALTGANGFIGKHLLDRLRQIADVKLVLFSRTCTAGKRENEVWISSALEDLSKQTWCDAGIQEVNTIFHLGAFTPKSSNSVDLVEEIYRSNLLGTRRLLEGLPNVPEKLIFSSTLDVYQSPAEGEVLTEKSPLVPPSLYGASKLFCEHLIEAYARKSRCRYAILRYGHIYGPGEKEYAKLIPVAIQALLRGESPVIYGDGSVLRDFLYVDDAAEATLRAAASELEKIEPVNVVSGISTSIRTIIELLGRLSGYTGEMRYFPERPGGGSLRFSNERMLNVLGHWEMTSLEEGLHREVAYFRNLLSC